MYDNTNLVDSVRLLPDDGDAERSVFGLAALEELLRDLKYNIANPHKIN